MDKRILTLGLLILVIAIIIFLLRFCGEKACPDIQIVHDRQDPLMVDDVVQFRAEAGDQENWHWTFSDGSDDQFDNPVTIHLSKAGALTVTLEVDNGCSKSETFTVNEAVRDTTTTKTLTYSIQGETNLIAGMSYKFKAIGTGAKKLQWDLDDRDIFITDKEEISHAYTQEGTYHLTLKADDASFTKTLNVRPKPDKPSVEKVTGEEIKNLLNQYGTERNETQQGVILKKLKAKLCNNEDISVKKANKPGYGKTSEQYYTEVALTYKPILKVELEFDPVTNCVTKITITD